MSAPLVVNTRDGVCWTRRTVTSSGIALYAPEGVCGCPEFVMATLSELAVHGIVGSADVLPVPVGSQPRTLDVVEDELTGVSLSLYEEELLTKRLRLALTSAQRGRRELRETVRHMCNELNGFDCPPPGETPLQLVTRVSIAWADAERRVAELEAERHETNEALDDAVQELRARPSCPCQPADPPHQVGCFFDGVPVSPPSERPVASLREVSSREEPHDSPLHRDYKGPGHDLPETGRSSTLCEDEPADDDPVPYWGPKDWTGPTAHCPSMRHRAPYLAERGVMGRHSISEGFTGSCPGMGRAPRETPWTAELGGA